MIKTLSYFKKGDKFGYIDPAIKLLPEEFEDREAIYRLITIKEPILIADMMDKYKPEMMTLGDVRRAIESGSCITNGYTNFFFVKNRGYGYSAVGVRKLKKHWDFSVFRPLDEMSTWGPGHRLFLS